jgi:ABC-2 type transport system ATP-binding protein/lipopolysaccharide transport system ATP-binding protein
MPRIRLSDATVAFPVSLSPQAAGSAQTGGRIDAATGQIVALDGITLDIPAGSRIGLIGHNGAGKSTLLRVMAGVYAPVRGEAEIDGSVATLFNATPGLNVDSTGRENIITCGLHLGLSLKEIRARAAEIAEFTELGGYLDLPVRIYSAGMLMRLGFAIATSLEPDILLIDEGLGTGDAGFTAKAEARMRELAERASILVVASHSMALLNTLCTTGIVLEHGKVVAMGPIATVLGDYRAKVAADASTGDKNARRAAYAMATELANTGQELPPELELQALIEALSIRPDDLSMLRRYRTLLTMFDKPVDPALDLKIEQATLRLTPEDSEVIMRIITLTRTHGLAIDEDIQQILTNRLRELTGADR